RLDHVEETDMAVRYFELRLLDELGYRPQLDLCARCGARLEPVQNSWSSAGGGAVGPECAREGSQQPLSLNALKVLRVLQKGSFSDCARLQLSGSLAAEIEACLAGHITHVVERQVRSVEFVDAVRRTR